MLRSAFWDEEKTARLREMVAAGLSSGSIAILLKCSRNAIISKARRLGLQLTGHVKDGQTNANIPGPSAPRPSHPPRPARVPTPFDVLPEVETIDGNGLLNVGVAFADLNSTHCRALIDDGRYCGSLIAHPKFSYCAEHAKAYLTTPARLKAREREEAERR